MAARGGVCRHAGNLPARARTAVRATLYRVISSTATPTIERRSTQGPTHPGEEICHIVTQDDPDTALCGKDVTGWPWNPPWPICVVCDDLSGSSVR